MRHFITSFLISISAFQAMAIDFTSTPPEPTITFKLVGVGGAVGSKPYFLFDDKQMARLKFDWVSKKYTAFPVYINKPEPSFDLNPAEVEKMHQAVQKVYQGCAVNMTVNKSNSAIESMNVDCSQIKD